MAQKIEADSFLERSRQGVLIDVRTPAEFAAGHIPGAVNLPLFSDEERAAVGTTYKQIGRDQAVEQGLGFVGPRMAAIVREAKAISQGREIFLYCWRGGMRSGSVAWLLETAGLRVTLLEGGYKAYRHHFFEVLERPWHFILLCGPTGCGKTELLGHIADRGGQVLDFEGLAHHKGSAFGGLGQQAQPTTEHFINLLHECLRGLDPARPVWCEGESMLVGHVFIPKELFDRVRRDTIVEVSMEREQRLDRLMAEYGCFPAEELAPAFLRITKRMGPEQVVAALEALEGGDVRTAASLALNYYDKSYARPASAPAATFRADNSDMARSAEELIKLSTL